MIKETSYTYLGKTYPVYIDKKSMVRRSIRCRYREGAFYISAPYLTSESVIMKYLTSKWGPYFIKNEKPAPKGNDFVYIYGFKHPYSSGGGEIKFSNCSSFKYKNDLDFDKKMKKHFLALLTERSRYYEKLMNLAPHNIRVRNMTSRYGSNSKKTRSITYAYSLYHYSVNILDAIIVHELSHSIEFNHSKKFYEVVNKYCPNYKALHNMLRKGVYHD